MRKLQRNKTNKNDIARTIEEWDLENDGDCLWWSFPIEEAPYCGTPLDLNFPDYVTHFTRIIEPLTPNELSISKVGVNLHE